MANFIFSKMRMKRIREKQHEAKDSNESFKDSLHEFGQKFIIVLFASLLVFIEYIGMKFYRKMIVSSYYFESLRSTNLLACTNFLAPTILAMLFGMEYAVAFGVFASIVLSVIFNYTVPQFLLTLVCTIAFGLFAAEFTSKKEVYFALFISLLCHIIICGFDILFYKPTDIMVYGQNFFVFATYLAVSVAITMLIILPICEKITGKISAMTVVDYASISHPIMQRLSRLALGTFSHSQRVGEMAQKAAKLIGANDLLALAGGYFHDIGKIQLPKYFTENQSSGENPHDKMMPSLSKVVLTNHVKDGLQLAKSEHIPNIIQRFIETHHGTSVMRSLLYKAGDTTNEYDYRYNCNLPVSIEETLVALADPVEAASRSMNNPTEDSVKELVCKIFTDKILDGQLSQSDMTLEDLSITMSAYISYIVDINHMRIEYPEVKEAEK